MNDTITITGNIVTPPERKVTANGLVITNFRVASGQRRYDRNAGAWVDDHTNFYGVSTYRSLAEHAYDSLHKGERVIVTGRFRLREWENSERKGVRADIEADAVGHVLLFGTSKFRRDDEMTSRATDSAQPEAPADGERAPAPVADWISTPVPTGELLDAATPF